MNGGPFRTPQSNEGGMVNSRSTSPMPARQPEEPRQPVQMPERQTPTATNREPAPRGVQQEQKPRQKSKLGLILAIVGLVLAVGVIGYFMVNKGAVASSQIENGKYQAVFFTNGQVYFGKLSQVNEGYFKLSDVFYLKAKDESGDSDKLQETTSGSSSDVQLIKLGNEIHGPKDEMVISAAQVLFFENLKPEGKVANSIDQYNKTNKK